MPTTGLVQPHLEATGRTSVRSDWFYVGVVALVVLVIQVLHGRQATKT